MFKGFHKRRFWALMGLMAVVVALASSTTARGATYIDGIPGQCPAAQRLADETASWVSTVTGVEHPSKTLIPVESITAIYGAKYSYALAVVPAGKWSIDSWRAADFTQVKTPYFAMYCELAKHRGAKKWSPDSAMIVLHELLHRHNSASAVDASIEEGVVDAMTHDLWPAWVRKFMAKRPKKVRHKTPFINQGYPFEAADLGDIGAKVLGEPSRRTYASRRWRMVMWGAETLAERRAMMGPWYADFEKKYTPVEGAPSEIVIHGH